MSGRRNIRLRSLAVIAVLGLVLTACGGGSETDSGVATLGNEESGQTLASQEDPLGGGEGTEDAELTREEALLAFTACLRDQGVDIEDPTVDADGNVRLSRPGGQSGQPGPGGDDTFREARAACADLLEDAALGFGGDVDRTELEDNLVVFAECMRDNGYDMPDPDFSAFGPGQGGGGPFGEVDRDDPAFQAAAEACEDILAGFGRGPGGGRTGGGGGNG